jgi:hypothetical protein
LTVDSSILTAIGNDYGYGYEMIFSRKIAGKMTDKDIFLGITTSGRSENIIFALKECKKKTSKHYYPLGEMVPLPENLRTIQLQPAEILSPLFRNNIQFSHILFASIWKMRFLKIKI